MDLIVCTESPKSELTKRVRMEAWREGHEPLRSTTKGVATSALTGCAFSWKFAGRRKDVLFGRRTLILFLLHRVVDRLSDDLAVLDQVGVSPISYPDVVVLVGPLQESHPSLDCPVGVLEGAMLGQLLTEHLRQLPVPLVPVECASVYQGHYVLREVAAEVLLQAALEAHLAAPVFGQVQVVVEHFLGRAATEVLHNAILFHIVEHADHQDDGTRTSTVHPKKGFHPSA